jgi:triosephosphate isomerase
MRRALIAGNWKLHGFRADLQWLEQVSASMNDGAPVCDVAVCPPATLIAAMAERAPGWIDVGAQDCSVNDAGAYTGEVSAAMLADAGCRYVIVGHSERRSSFGESDAIVRLKAERAIEAGLTPIICVGESLSQREAGEAEAFCTRQLRASMPDAPAGRMVVAYEPIWAIGTGQTASAQDAQAIHEALRAACPGGDGEALRILYGGSVKPGNAAALLSQKDVDGALVGGASLDARSFAAVLRSTQ